MDQNALRGILEDLETRSPRYSGESVRRNFDLAQHLDYPEVTVVTGVRRCGKSSLLLELIADLRKSPSWGVLYIDFEDPRLNGFRSEDFQQAYELWLSMRQETPQRILFAFDEIQNVAGWERWAAYFATDPKHKVVITGSNSTLLSSELASSLTGRHRSVRLMPFSFAEVTSDIPPESSSSAVRTELQRRFARYRQHGGFPRAYISEDSTILAQYFRDIVQRDIALRHGVRNPKALVELGRILATDNTRLLNKSRAAEAIGVKQQLTVAKFCQYFVETFLFFDVRKFDHSLRNQQRSLSKFYCVDVALAAAAGFRFSENDGAALENMVFLELQRRGYEEIFYWKAKSTNVEVDFVVRNGSRLTHAIQVCVNIRDKRVLERELKALHACREFGAESLCLITLDTERLETRVPSNVNVISFIDWARSG